MKVKYLVMVLDAKVNVKIWSDKNTVIYEGKAYTLYDDDNDFMNRCVEDMRVSDNEVYILLLNK